MAHLGVDALAEELILEEIDDGLKHLWRWVVHDICGAGGEAGEVALFSV